jgi:hypothetical protein
MSIVHASLVTNKKGFITLSPDCPQSLGARGQQAVRLRVLWLQDHLSEHSQRSQANGIKS